MRLKVLAVLVWLCAIGFTLFVAPAFQSDQLKNLLASHGSLTVVAKVKSSIRESKGFNNSVNKSVSIEILKPDWMKSKNGQMTFNQEDFREGDAFQAVVSFRRSHTSGQDFKASLKHLISKSNGSNSNWVADTRRSFLSNLSGVTADSAALVAGLAIGDDSRLSEQTKSSFKTVSLTHLTAVSGANCAIVLAALAFLILRIPIGRRTRIVLSLAVLFGYLEIVGDQPSVLRAATMVGFVLLGMFFGRKVDPLDALSLSIILLLCCIPTLSLDYGFALSVFATFGLLVLAPRLSESFAKRMPSWLALLVAVTVSAQIACLPILLILQPKLPVYAVFANLLAEPLVVPITLLGILSCVIAPWFPQATELFTWLASVPAEIIIWIATTFANAPSSSIKWFSGSFGIGLAIVFAFGCFGYFLLKRKALKISAALAVFSVVVTFVGTTSTAAISSSAFYSGDYTLVNCDVGQGDALVIRSAGAVAVVDVGREDAAIDHCLTALGINSIDLLVLTHFDVDHIGGVMGAITGREIQTALLTSFHDDRPGADFAEQALAAQGIAIERAEKGMSGTLGEFSWRVLSPHRDAPEAEDSNDGSISMYWEDSRMALFTLADLGERGQLRVGQEQASFLTSGFGGRTVVVKVAHHGSADQASEFYEAIKPSLAIISVGEHNSYGHPTERTLNFLRLLGTEIARTDHHGAVGVKESSSGLDISFAGRS